MLRVLLAGGGTAGHVNPALAIAEIIKNHYADAEICFAGNPNKLEARLVPKAGYKFEPIQVEGFQRKINANNIKRNFHAVGCLLKSGSRAKEIIKTFKPDIVIGTGGYVSGPILKEAASMGIKTAIHEQNAFPGVTNKILSKRADAVMLTVEAAKQYLPCTDHVTVTGLPVRNAFDHMTRTQAREKLGFSQTDVCVLSTGGSLGARVLNEHVAKLLKWYQDNDVNVYHIHSYGTYEGYKDFVTKLGEQGVKIKDNNHLIIKDYIDMPLAMAAADLVISRCGAASLAEIEAVGRASILIPSPMVAENHQYYNGMVLQNAGAGVVIEEKDLTDELFIETVKSFIDDKEKIKTSAENALKLNVADTDKRIFNVLEPLIKEALKAKD